MTMELHGTPAPEVRLSRLSVKAAGIGDRTLRDATSATGATTDHFRPRAHVQAKLATPSWAQPRSRHRRLTALRMRQALIASDALVFVGCGLTAVIGTAHPLTLVAAFLWLVLMVREDLIGCGVEICPPRRALVNGALAISTLAVGAVLTNSAPAAKVGLLFIAGGSLLAAALRQLFRSTGLQTAWGAAEGETILLVGPSTAAAETIRHWAAAGQLSRVAGICLTDHSVRTEGMPERIGDVEVVGLLDDVTEAVHQTQAALVAVLPASNLSEDALRRLTWLLESTGAELSMVTPLMDVAHHRVRPTAVGRHLLVRVGHASPAGGAARVKAAVDRILAAVLLVVTAPVFLLLAVLIRLDSPGPALFRQQRVREAGRLFTILKFRTMHSDAEVHKLELAEMSDHGNGILFKMRNDPRVTRIGKVLRATSLDELPQLVNVLRGEMSLVGPRPALPDEVARYEEATHRRLAVKPGITGLWQVSGRSNLSWEDSVRLDLHYVDNWRHSHDLGILFRTVRAVLRRDGAC